MIICKNTLHHIPRISQLYLLKKLLRAGKIVIIIEIENPLKFSFNSFIWNFYYRKFLKDDGTNFVCDNEFNTLLNKAKRKNLLVKVFHTYLKTIKGNYLFAIINYNKKEYYKYQLI